MVTGADRLHRLARERVAVFCLFASFGGVIATWAVHLPSVKEATGISTSLLGAILLILGAGALLGMQISGGLVDRLGSRRIGVVGVAGMALALLLPLSATSWWAAALGAGVLGVTTGTAEVGINAAAVDVERDYGRPIMAAFHGVFSIGTVLGSLLGAAGFALGAGVLATGVVVAGIALSAVGVAAAILLRGEQRHHEAPPASDDGGQAPRLGRIVVLGVLAFLLLLAEGSAMDWSSLHAQQHLGAGPSIGALALGSFVAAMTVVRFTVDRVVERVGPVRVVRWGAATAGVGFVIVMFSPVLPLTLVGWAVVGLGLSGGVPQVFTAAGNLGGGAGRVLSRVVGTGYLAVLAGPGVLGWLADRVTLNAAFALPSCGVLVCVALAGAVAR